MSPRRRDHNPRDYPRAARVGELLRQILAEELERLDDERLGLVTIVEVDVEADLSHATVFVSTLSGGEDDDRVLAALDDLAPALKRAVGDQARLRRMPDLRFRPDEVGRSAARIEAILGELDLPDDDPDDDES